MLSLFKLSYYEALQLLNATYETVYMTFVSTFFIAILGFLLGISLFVFSKNNKLCYQSLSFFVNIIRSIPFIILIILLIPFSKIITGTILGVNAAIPSLVVGLTPFYAKMVETSLNKVDNGIIELSYSLGASTKNMIFKFLLPESLPSLASNLVNIIISNISFSAICGVIGAGGLGSLAYLEGFEQNNQSIIYYSVIITLFLILLIQLVGNYCVKHLTK